MPGFLIHQPLGLRTITIRPCGADVAPRCIVPRNSPWQPPALCRHLTQI